MRILFVAYCMVNNENGDSLIGVYKRCLRIGFELVQHRRHEVSIFCTGRQDYHDVTVELAETMMQFVDFSFKVLFCPSVDLRRRYYRKAFSQIKPDLVVVGEVPLAGTLLDATLCAAGLGIPVVVLDNAYNPQLARAFYESHGPMVDGIVLTGLDSFQMQEPPPLYCAVPPLLSGTGDEALALLKELGFGSRKLVTVLGYERKAETLAAALLAARSESDVEAIFLTSQPEESLKRLGFLPPELRSRIAVLPPPSEAELFSLLRYSSVVIGKCGFMQVSECLALGTPFLGVQYRGCFAVEMLPSEAQQFVHATDRLDAHLEILETFDRFLHVRPEQLQTLHSSRSTAVRRVADFLESLPSKPRKGCTSESSHLGYSVPRIEQSLATLHEQAENLDQPIEVEWVRCSRLRNYPQCRIDSVTAAYTFKGKRKQAYLWGRQYAESCFANQDCTLASSPDSPRRILYRSPDDLLLLEVDAGESCLPPLNL